MAEANLMHLQPTERRALLELAQKLQEQYARLILTILLFGSKARGEDTPDSDLDVLIVVDSDDWQLHKQVCYLAADIGLKYNLNLSPRIWSVSHLREMKEMEASFYQNIRQDGISLLAHDAPVVI
jgi:predicted nucleotidyltransferase